MKSVSFIPTTKEGDQVYNNLADRFKSGTMWLDDGDALNYLYVYMGACLTFLIIYIFYQQLFT